MSFEITADPAIEAALDSEEFDVFSFVKQAKQPTGTEVIYTDADAAVQISKLLESEAPEDEFSITDGGLDDEAEYELSELHQRLVGSALEITFTGLAPAARKALEKHLQATTDYTEDGLNTEYYNRLTSEIAARSITQVEHVGSGKVSTAKWTAEQVNTFVDDLYPNESAKFFAKAMELTYVKAEVFDRAVTADFS